ncbi:MAG TPA: hypothetical protein DD383_02695 [Rikenellaceae bacterium]|nr:hypothetical protein [Rikenellaceae bacterium]
MEKNSKAPTIEEFRELLKKKGLKITPQRIAVHEAMLKLGHACADMVTAEILAAKKAKVTVASVYNILTQLSLLGIYHHRLSENNKMYFDVNTFKHFHLYDTVSHVYSDVIDDELYSQIEGKLLARRFKGYKIDGIDVQILAHPSTRIKK